MIGFLTVVGSVILMMIFRVVLKDLTLQSLRDIPAFHHLNRAVDLTVETGKCVHITLGHGGVERLPGASSLAGIQVVQNVIKRTGMSDQPPVASSGEAVLSLLSTEAVNRGYRNYDMVGLIDKSNAPLTGLTPFSYAAGTLPIMLDRNASVDLMVGSFGSEVALLADAGERSGNLILGGSEDLSAQAVIIASSQQFLTGEDLFAAGAYLQSGKMNLVSLLVQDVLRWVVIIAVLLGVALKILGIL